METKLIELLDSLVISADDFTKEYNKGDCSDKYVDNILEVMDITRDTIIEYWKEHRDENVN